MRCAEPVPPSNRKGPCRCRSFRDDPRGRWRGGGGFTVTGSPEAISAVIVETPLDRSDRKDAGLGTGGDRQDPHVARRPRGRWRAELPVALKVPPPLHTCSHIGTESACQQPEGNLAARACQPSWDPTTSG